MFTNSVAIDPAPAVTLLVGPDADGHWLVQEADGALEGCFVSREAALHFARWERHAYRAAIVALAEGPLTSRLAV
ncbi:hypothetical protein [Sphingomonas crusticola]|uniref:hypothetical protein n=1 Tax=Sphingomonas crusticola TaxID=1697973 RepID=UPI000E255045|nr:hypothetical protein [Sphingomonas crusticola]